MEQCRVAVFLNDAASGATLGYYGTIVGIRGKRMPSYWVHVPALDRVLRVSEADILVLRADKLEPLSDVASAWCLEYEKWEIEFESPLGPDNDELRGKYRIGGRLKGRFHFLKRNQSYPTYQFAIPAQGNLGKGNLNYCVPAKGVLDRAFVMHALSEILGVGLPPAGEDVSPTTGPGP
jgi:hypothetical protein